MEPPPPPPSSTQTPPSTSPRPPIPPSKLRLMCSYGGHIVPRPHDKSLFYAGGETRIVAVDRRTTAASLSSFAAYFSRMVFNNRQFLLKYQLPGEDLDSLISVVTDEDLSNMLDEHDKVTAPARIRLFLFPVKPESLGSTLFDPKSESWFCDALKSTGILQKGQSADSGLLMGLGSDLDAPAESGSNSGGGEAKPGAESLVLEISSSFGSTNSSLSMSISPPVGTVHCDDNGLNLLEKKTRVPSSASLESENSVGNANSPPKPGTCQEPLIQIAPEAPSFLIESGSSVSDNSFSHPTQNTGQVLGYPVPQQPDGNQLHHEPQLIPGGLQYIPQYSRSAVPVSPYYPVYMHQQHIPVSPNHPYPIYLVPVRPTQYNNMSVQSNVIDINATISSSRPPLHPQTPAINPRLAHKEVFGAQVVPESTAKVYQNNQATATTPEVSSPSNQGQLATGIPDPEIASDSVTTTSMASAVQSNEFDEDVAYNQIYKTQPLAPVLPSLYQTITKGTTVMLSESSVLLQQNPPKQQATLHPL